MYQALDLQLQYIQQTGKYQTALRVNGEDKTIDPSKKLIVFRMIQEILNNSIKHAKSQIISVELNYTKHTTVLNLQDDGMGFEAEQTRKWVGIDNLYYRANLIGAGLTIGSEPGKGTQVQLILPAAV